MTGRLPGETISQFAIRVAWEYGHFWNYADNPEGASLSYNDLQFLKADDPVVVKAMISLSKMDSTRYTKAVLKHHGRMPHFDGQIGPAMESILDGGRCPIPDYAPPPGVVFAFDDPDIQQIVERMQSDAQLPAFGSGNWKGCHNVGEYHSASIGVDTSGLPGFLKPLFVQVLKNVQAAYAGVGLLFRFISTGGTDLLTGESFVGNINSDMSFVNNSSGWIGLAIVGLGETCGSKIWCKFLATYKGGSDTASIITQWTTLIKHELGHNCGRGHTNGGVMNPSLVNGLPTAWGPDDPSTSWLKGQFGGVPVPIPGSPLPPDVPPTPPTTIEQRLHALEVKNVVQDVTLNWCVGKLRDLELRS